MSKHKLVLVIITDKGQTAEQSHIEGVSEEQTEYDTILQYYVCENEISAVNEVLVGCENEWDVMFIHDKDFIQADELAEMKQVLDLCERHGMVVPDTMKKSSVDSVKRYTVLPYLHSVPVLVKGDLFVKFGTLNIGYQSVFGALAEFSMRVNEYGWNVIKANGVQCCKLNSCVENTDYRILEGAYPYLHDMEEVYAGTEQTAAENFEQLLTDCESRKPKVLFSMYEVPPVYNGTANYAIQLLKHYIQLYGERYDISVLIQDDSAAFHHISEISGSLFNPYSVLNEKFDLGYSFSQILQREHLGILNRCCLKYGVCMLDIICLRSNYLYRSAPNRYRLFRDSVRFSDFMLSISEFSLNDVQTYFRSEIEKNHVMTGYVYLGNSKSQESIEEIESELPFKKEEYFVVVGNPYKHKMIEPVVEILKKTTENAIVIGTKTEGFCNKEKTIYGYVSGWLDHKKMNSTLMHAKGIIFPSVYEGFGLTFYDAMVYRKKIIVSDIQMNRELYDFFEEYQDNIILYEKVSDIENIIKDFTVNAVGTTDQMNIRNYEDVAKDLEYYIDKILNQSVDLDRIERRWEYLQQYLGDGAGRDDMDSKRKKEAFEHWCIAKFPKVYQLYRKIVVMIDKDHYGNH